MTQHCDAQQEWGSTVDLIKTELRRKLQVTPNYSSIGVSPNEVIGCHRNLSQSVTINLKT